MKYKRIRSLRRGIEVLRYLNTVKGAQPVDIGKELGLPRPTIHRILEALEELELVYNGPNSRDFRLTPGVRRLAGGGGNFHHLRTASWPAMRDLTAEVIWPSSLAVFHNDAMLIVESTDRLSPMSSKIGMIGQSCPMLASSLGQAYLSHCHKEQRDAIIAKLGEDTAGNEWPAGGLEGIDRMVEAGSRDGFGMYRDLLQGHCMSIAVPVRVNGAAIASLNIVWHGADLTFEQAQERLSRPLLQARDQIEANLPESSWTSSAVPDTDGPSYPSGEAYPKRMAPSLSVLPALKAAEIAANCFPTT
ncbi:MAG: helix-turn-helix domain-containing protein [Azospirillaceae bacterium]|nr:helix-turn-helix domain-containing protein [Azospirillaceae bacterium]